MIENLKIVKEFERHGGVLKTAELKALGLSSRQIKKLLEKNEISKIKYGYYELAGEFTPEDVIIARLFPKAVIFLESALFHYSYTDRIPSAWQIAVDRNSEKSKYEIEYPFIRPFYQKSEFLSIGVTTYELQGVEIKIFDRDRTMCDVMRYEKKLENEVFSNAVKRYISDKQKNIRHLFEYAEVFNITRKVQVNIGKWI